MAAIITILQIKNFKEKEKLRQEQQRAKKEVKRMWDEILSNLLQKR